MKILALFPTFGSAGVDSVEFKSKLSAIIEIVCDGPNYDKGFIKLYVRDFLVEDAQEMFGDPVEIEAEHDDNIYCFTIKVEDNNAFANILGFFDPVEDDIEVKCTSENFKGLFTPAA